MYISICVNSCRSATRRPNPELPPAHDTYFPDVMTSDSRTYGSRASGAAGQSGAGKLLWPAVAEPGSADRCQKRRRADDAMLTFRGQGRVNNIETDFCRDLHWNFHWWSVMSEYPVDISAVNLLTNKANLLRFRLNNCFFSTKNKSMDHQNFDSGLINQG